MPTVAARTWIRHSATTEPVSSLLLAAICAGVARVHLDPFTIIDFCTELEDFAPHKRLAFWLRLSGWTNVEVAEVFDRSHQRVSQWLEPIVERLVVDTDPDRHAPPSIHAG